jgi:hypothetical protein
VQKHPSFCEASLHPPEDKSANHPTIHAPFDEQHLRIKGVTQANIRYFAKKHWVFADDPLIILGLLRTCYPLQTRYYNPDLRKLFDIAYRERKQKLYEENPQVHQNPGLI